VKNAVEMLDFVRQHSRETGDLTSSIPDPHGRLAWPKTGVDGVNLVSTLTRVTER
jgi:hypothetical protein